MKKIIAIAAIVLSAGAYAFVAYANHSWGNYHWARTSNPFTLKLGDNVSSAWDSYLVTASSDWSVSSVLDTTIVFGQTNPKNCRPKSGKVEVCNNRYGNNGWLGVAQIWIMSDGHITQGTVKVNDTYFNTARYNSPAWKQLVMCQEIGHTFGLGHQDENFYNANLGTCMDYTSDPLTNQHPNQHDYVQLESIYSHTDLFTTLLGSINGKKSSIAADDLEINTDAPSDWGKAIKKSADGRNSLYERDLGNGQKLFTFVIWAEQGAVE